MELYVDSRYPVTYEGVTYQVRDISSNAENSDDKLMGISTFEIPLVGFLSTEVDDFILLVATTSGVSRPYFVSTKSNNTLAYGKSEIDYFPAGYTPSPLDVGGCCLWMDAADSSTVTLSSTKVSKWTDKSTNKYTMNQSNTTKQPTYTNNSLNGFSTLSFASGSSQYLYGDASANKFSVGTKCYSIFAVCKTLSTSGSVFTKSLYGPGGGRISLGREAGNYLCFVTHSNDLGLYTNYPDSNNNYRILEMVINRVSGNDTLYENTTAKVSSLPYTSDTGTNLTNSLEMLIGAYGYTGTPGLTPVGGYYLSGDIAEIVCFANPYDMTIATRLWVEGYLAWKWGLQTLLPSAHPYYSGRPSAPPP